MISYLDGPLSELVANGGKNQEQKILAVTTNYLFFPFFRVSSANANHWSGRMANADKGVNFLAAITPFSLPPDTQTAFVPSSPVLFRGKCSTFR